MEGVINATGRRKEAVAKVFLVPGSGSVEINKQSPDTYFPTEAQRLTIRKMFDLADLLKKYDIRATVNGGGKSGQVDALKLGVARAVIKVDPSLKKSLKTAGVLRRDPRMKERKKYGRKRARRRFQYTKR